ncbi:unnamed protein product [Prunus brigantina]
MIVGMLELSSQGHRRGSQVGRSPNVDRHRHSRGKNLLEDYFIPNSMYSNVDFRGRYKMQPHLFNKIMHNVCYYDAYFIQKCDVAGVLRLLLEQKLTTVLRMLTYGASADQVDEIARMGKSTTLELVAESQNYLNVLGQSSVFNDVLRGEAPNITYEINNTVYWNGYYLADGIYLRWTTFVKSISHPRSEKEKLFSAYQERCRKMFWYPPSSMGNYQGCCAYV